jgi:outer membrane receptor protein involved in Fe transport
MQLLQSAPANAISSVEVITNPPASYDADSGAVININMSKNLIAGYRGSLYSTYTQGVYPRYNVGTSQFFKNDHISFNLNYNYTNQKINRDNLSVVNFLDEANEVSDVWTSDINRTTRSEVHNVNLNFDYEIDESNQLSFSATGLFTPYYQYNIFNNTDIEDPNGVFLSRFTASNDSRDDKFNLGTDLDYRKDFESGASLIFNAHYTRYDYSRDQNVFSEFFDMDNDFDFDSEFNTLANQDTEILSSKLDLQIPLQEQSATLDLGIKFSNVQTDSDITKTDIINGLPQLDPLNSDQFVYDEKVFAAYANYSKSWEQWDLNLGLRVEQTNIEGQSLTLEQTNTQDYFEWFPNLSLSYQMSETVSIYTTYKRSITRPDYTNLNPFSFFLNENTVVVGNPALQPTFVDQYKIGTNFLEHFTVEAYYSNYDGAINELPRQNNSTNIISFVPVNLDKTVDFGFDFYVDYYISDWWSLFALTSFYNITEETKFGEDFISLSQWSNISMLSNNWYLLSDGSLNIGFNLTYGNKNLQGLALVDTRLISDLSVSKSILKNKAIVFLSIEDIFNEQDFLTEVNYLNQSSSNFTDLDNRFIKLGFRYKFGNTNLMTNERSSEMDERKRLKESTN